MCDAEGAAGIHLTGARDTAQPAVSGGAKNSEAITG
jgi:hypothetical protein